MYNMMLTSARGLTAVHRPLTEEH